MADFIDFILVGVRHDATSCVGLRTAQSAKAFTSQTVDDTVMVTFRRTTRESRLSCIQNVK